VVLKHGGAVVDALCSQCDAATQTALTTCSTAYTCEGAPVVNPHDNGTGTNADASLERKPSSAFGKRQDTGDSAADFTTNMTATPRNLASPPAP